MNVFNRIVVILLLLVLLAAALLLAVLPLESLSALRQGLGLVANGMQTLEATQFWLLMAIRVAVVVVVLVVVALLLWAELRPQRPKTVRVQTDSGSRVQVTAESVARRLAWHIDQLADVVAVTPQVRPHGRLVDVSLDLRTTPEIDVRMKTDEVVALTREVVTQRMGLEAGKIEVRIEHAPYADEA